MIEAQQITVDLQTAAIIVGSLCSAAFAIAGICIRFAFTSRIKIAKLEERVDLTREDLQHDVNQLGNKVRRALEDGED